MLKNTIARARKRMENLIALAESCQRSAKSYDNQASHAVTISEQVAFENMAAAERREANRYWQMVDSTYKELGELANRQAVMILDRGVYGER